MDGQAGDLTREIVITPEMVEAGAIEFSGFNEAFGSIRQGAAQVIEAALLAGGYAIRSQES